jgi:preprotein translocase subunit SecE
VTDTIVDKVKTGVAVALFIAGIAAFYYWSEALLILRVGAVLVGTAAAVIVFWTTPLGKQFFAFSQESIEETKRVVWPNRKETLQTTGVVFAFVLIMAIFLGVLDSGLAWAFKVLLGWGGD